MEQTHGSSKKGAKSPEARRAKAVTPVSSKAKRILDLQRRAGNQAVSGAVNATTEPGLVLQRQPELTVQRMSWEDFVKDAFGDNDSDAERQLKEWADKMAGRGGSGSSLTGGGKGSGGGGGGGGVRGTTSTSYVRAGTGTKLSESAQKLQIKRDLLAKKSKPGEKLTEDEKAILGKTTELTKEDRKILKAEEDRVKEAKAYESYQAKLKADEEKKAKQLQLDADNKERGMKSGNLTGFRKWRMESNQLSSKEQSDNAEWNKKTEEEKQSAWASMKPGDRRKKKMLDVKTALNGRKF